MQTNDRNVASFIQDMLHLKPHEERELQHPLAFLLPPHDVKVGLTPLGRFSMMRCRATNAAFWEI